MSKSFKMYIGESAALPYYMDLNGSKFQNIIVNGPGGSGKSTFVHNCIGYLMNHYSRSEVCLKVLNLNWYNEYDKYAPGEVEVTDLPLFQFRDISDAESLLGRTLDYLVELFDVVHSRQSLFSDNHWRNFGDVPAVVGIPRIVLIVSTLDVLFRPI